MSVIQHLRLTTRHNILLKQISATITSTSVKLSPFAGTRNITMMSMENELPHLPVPPLQQTMHKYLCAVKPLLCAREYEVTSQAVDEFCRDGGIGPKLQDMLEEKASKHNNWLATWWDNLAYFGNRSSVVITSSPGILFPRVEFTTDADYYRYSAVLLRSVLQFKDMVDLEHCPVEYAGKDPLTMRQYMKLLSVSRTPDDNKDNEMITARPQSRHVIVACNGHLYRMNVYQGSSFTSLSEDDFIHQFASIYEDAHPDESLGIGILTSLDRNTWAKVWQRMRHYSRTKENIDKESTDLITRAICVICLDKPVPVPLKGSKNQRLWESTGLEQVLYGGGPEQNSCNRWFDKTCQFVINRNGMSGLCYEHSGAEGGPVMALCNLIMKNCQEITNSSPATTKNFSLTAPPRLQWQTKNHYVEDMVKVAKENMAHAAYDLELRSFTYNVGKNIPKSFGLSPDAFFQIALQLAYFRLHGHMAPTYESGSLRRYQKGRTETIRQSTSAALDFCRVMSDDNHDDAANKRELFIQAVQDHVTYTRDAMMMNGIDRHLLGLRLIARENGMKTPEFFRDGGYAYSVHFKLSTSQVPSIYDACLCFGPVVPDGYGVCYNPRETQFNVAISAYHSHPKTRAGDLGEFLGESLNDVQLLLATSSKL